MDPVRSTSATWIIRSKLPGRLRVSCRDLAHSNLLRHHCAATLHACHWVHQFRINPLNGNLILHFPTQRSKLVPQLLERSLSIAEVNNVDLEDIAKIGEGWRSSEESRAAIRNAMRFGALLVADAFLPIPAFIMIGGAALSLTPALKEVIAHWRHKRKLSPESLELAFAGALISQGHARETLLDIVLGDSSNAIAGMADGEDEPHSKSREFFRYISEEVSLEPAGKRKARIPLKNAKIGDTYRIGSHAHVYLMSTVIEGELIVINRLFDGDWRPYILKRGDTAQPGALIIKGDATLEVKREIISDQIHFIEAFGQDRSNKYQANIATTIETLNAKLTPILLGAGAIMTGFGAAERALGLLQFTPYQSWKSTRTSARLTAIYNLGLQGIHFNNIDSLLTIGKAKHIIISRSCLDHIGEIKTREHVNRDSGTRKGELLRILAGVQNYLTNTDHVKIWSDQLSHIPNPAEIQSIQLGNLLTEGWLIELSNGRQLTIHEQPQTPDHIPQSHLDPLEINENGNLLGHVELVTTPGSDWIAACRALKDIGTNIHIVGSDTRNRMLEIAHSLEIKEASDLHGSMDAKERLDLVQTLQSKGGAVIYIGYLLCDLPALTAADVSMCIDVDSDSAVTGAVCDIRLGADPQWLARLIQISRRLERTETSNFNMISSCSIATGVAATAGLVSPLSTVLLSNIPMFLAELRNIASTQSNQSA